MYVLLEQDKVSCINRQDVCHIYMESILITVPTCPLPRVAGPPTPLMVARSSSHNVCLGFNLHTRTVEHTPMTRVRMPSEPIQARSKRNDVLRVQMNVRNYYNLQHS